MSKKEPNLTKIVNSSGFLFQERIRYEIEQRGSEHRWDVTVDEHPWWNRATGTEGFIDLVLTNKKYVAVVECKRGMNESWIFLVPSGRDYDKQQFNKARCAYFNRSANPAGDLQGFGNTNFRTNSYVARFCVIGRKNKVQSTVLEHLSRKLLQSLNAFVGEDLSLLDPESVFVGRRYIPCIITGAKLHVCRYDLNSLSVEDALLKTDPFEEIPWIWFQKPLAVERQTDPKLRHVRNANKAQERGIFIVNSSNLSEALKQLGRMEDYEEEARGRPWEEH